jgi:two-component system cell cycle sensor histidine kinase/response regulator CckA
MGESGSVRVAFETARLRLAGIKAEGQQSRLVAYRSACERSARTLGVERVSVWFFNEGRDALTRVIQYTLSTNSFDQGGEIRQRGAEGYFAALRSRRIVAARDALADARTSQLEAYLKRERVTALLDAPIYRDGEVVGVVCHEHVGGPRDWTEHEAGFATAVADLLTILIHQAERAELRAAIESQREMESQHQKMQALLRLARVVVHDLSNVLTVASLQASEVSHESDTEAARNVVEVLAYGGKLVAQLRAFCEQREGASRVEAVALLKQLEPTIRSLLGKNVSFRLSVALDSFELATTPLELEQLVVNLCMNARDAVGERGEVSVTLSRSDEGALLEVRDNGVGMDEATQARLFEPFYTTKVGHTGVGLAAVYGIVERAHGRVEVQSAVGHGTAFRITLPPARGASDRPWEF